MRLICAGFGAFLLASTLVAQTPRLPADHPEVPATPSREALADLTERLRPSDGPVNSTPIPRRNFIDEHIFGKMQKDGIPSAPLATDAEFFRRVHLDLTGRTPKDDELRAYLADKDPQKRNKLIDKLV